MKTGLHLNDQEMLERLLGAKAVVHPHLEHCELCRAEEQRLQRALQSFGRHAREDAVRSQDFWDRQRTTVRALTAVEASYGSVRAPRLAWAGVAAVLTLGAILLGSGSPAGVPPQAAVDPDDELLVRVEQAVESNTPAALEPATLLAEEINNSIEPTSNSKILDKENRK